MKNTNEHRLFYRLAQVLFLSLVLLSVNCTLLTVNSYSEIPKLINYQGRLTDKDNKPLEGAYNVTFRIYDAETAGNLLWEEAHTGIVVKKGVFSVLLGSVTNLNLPFDKQYFLEIKVGNEVMNPRQRITSAGYAIRAEKAEMTETIKGIDKAGLSVENNPPAPNTALLVHADTLNIQGIIKSPVDIVVDSGVNGVNGLDTGTKVGNTWYYLWIIYNPTNDVTAGLLSASFVSPVLPSGYTKKRIVGTVRTNAAGNFIKFCQRDTLVLYDDIIKKANSYGNGWTDLDISDVIPRISTVAYINTSHYGGVSPASSLVIYIRRNGSSATIGQYYATLYSGYQTTTGFVNTDNSQIIEYKTTNNGAGGSIDIFVIGFVLSI